LFLLKLEQANGVGDGVGLRVGDVEGAFVVGAWEGGGVGSFDGEAVVGDVEGALEGRGVGGTGGGVGPRVGDVVGAVGEEVGDLDGLDDTIPAPLKVFVSEEDVKGLPMLVATTTPLYLIV
jgi:hypothetical protein